MTDLAKLVVKLEAQTTQYIAQLDAANKKLSNFSKDQGLSLGKIAKAFAAFEAGKFFFELVKGAIDTADHLNDLSKISGVSTESLSKLAFAAGQSGGTLEDVATGMKKLNLAMSEAAGKSTSDAGIAFGLLGIKVQDTSGHLKDADEIFKEVADKFAVYADGANKNAIANQLFGKSFEVLIPLLNEGRNGIDALGAQAEKFGVVVSGDTAKAADEFNDKLGELKAQLITGLGQQIAADILPAFNNLAKAWDEDGNRAETFAAVAGALATTLKVLVTAGIIITSVFQQLGQVIYSVNAAMYDVAHLDFKQAWEELKSGFHSAVDNVSHDMDKIAALWGDTTKEVNKTPIVPKIDPPNVAAAIEAQKKLEEEMKRLAAEAKAAQKKLGDMASDLGEQVATFGKGTAAALEYRLTIGSLSDDVAKAGDAGAKSRDKIIELSNALEKLNDQKAVIEISQQIDELTGHTVDAAAAAFDLSNALLKASLIKQDNQDGLARLETLRKLTIAQAEFNDLEKQRQDILDNLARSEDQIQHSQEVGAINELEALDKLDSARMNAVSQLDSIVAKENDVAKASGNPALIKNAQQSTDALTKLGEQTDLLGQKMKSTFEDIGGDAIASFLDGTKSATDAAKDFIKSLEKAIADFVAKDLIRRFLGNSLSGNSGGGGGGGGGGLLSAAATFFGGLFGGSKDSGGMGQPGKAYAIGTGAQPEIFIPRSHGEFIPATQMSGGGPTQVHQYFSFASPTDRRTQTQVGAKAAGGVANAQRRNG